MALLVVARRVAFGKHRPETVVLVHVIRRAELDRGLFAVGCSPPGGCADICAFTIIGESGNIKIITRLAKMRVNAARLLGININSGLM